MREVVKVIKQLKEKKNRSTHRLGPLKSSLYFLLCRNYWILLPPEDREKQEDEDITERQD